MKTDIESVRDIERLDNEIIKVLGVEDEVESKKVIGLIDREIEQLDAGYRSLGGTPKLKKFPCPTGCLYYCSAPVANIHGFGNCNCCRCSWYEWIWTGAVICAMQEIGYAVFKSKGMLIPCEKPNETNCGFPYV